MMDVRPAGPEDMGAIKTLLAVCLLPTQDVRHGDIAFYVAESERGIIGVAGFESCGNDTGLLRSVAVMPGYRKQHIARRLVQRVVTAAADLKIDRLYLLTENARDYFANLGFSSLDRKAAPEEVRNSSLFSKMCSPSAGLMLRSANKTAAPSTEDAGTCAAVAAQRHFDEGYYCAEAVLLAVASQSGIHSPLLPAIATGFCNGVARTWGTCGALNGAIMAVNLAYGRSHPKEPVAQNYIAIRKLVDQFGRTCGATSCSELLACDLDTPEGQRVYEENRLRNQCREYVAIATRIAATLVEEKADKPARVRSAVA